MAARALAVFGDALALAFELIVTPGIFGVGGFFLDRWAGTLPVFTITFTVVVLSYMIWKTWATYEADMRAEEAKLRERRDG